jgi:F-type H+-transporting ATPase subunit b
MSVRALSAALASALLPALVWASEEAHEHGAHGHEGIPWGTLAFNLVNFLIFCAIVARYGMPVIRDYVRNRHQRIVGELEAAAKARADAEQLKAEWEARLAGLDAEIKRIRAETAADVARERDQILAAAKKTAETIRNDARRTADQEVRRAEADLRQTVAEQATAIATQLVREKLTTDDQDRFTREFLGHVKETAA